MRNTGFKVNVAALAAGMTQVVWEYKVKGAFELDSCLCAFLILTLIKKHDGSFRAFRQKKRNDQCVFGKG